MSSSSSTQSEAQLAVISRCIIEQTTAPIAIKKVGVGYVWSFRIGPAGSYWRGGGRTVGTEAEARAEAEKAALAIIEPYRERIPRETEVTFAEFAAIVGVRERVDV